jgi:hypothetical protein
VHNENEFDGHTPRRRLLVARSMSALLKASIKSWASPGVMGLLIDSSSKPAGSAGSGSRAAACVAAVRFFFIGISMIFTFHDMPRTQNSG